MKAINIIWDVATVDELDNLPEVVNIPDDLMSEDEISDYLSDTYEFCHKGFDLVTEKGEDPKYVNINDGGIWSLNDLKQLRLDERKNGIKVSIFEEWLNEKLSTDFNIIKEEL